jgi:hypothetical protein
MSVFTTAISARPASIPSLPSLAMGIALPSSFGLTKGHRFHREMAIREILAGEDCEGLIGYTTAPWNMSRLNRFECEAFDPFYRPNHLRSPA